MISALMLSFAPRIYVPHDSSQVYLPEFKLTINPQHKNFGLDPLYWVSKAVLACRGIGRIKARLKSAEEYSREYIPDIGSLCCYVYACA